LSRSKHPCMHAMNGERDFVFLFPLVLCMPIMRNWITYAYSKS